MPVRDVLIVAAGPSGLATAIAAKHHGLDALVVEKGVVVDSIFRFPVHMVFFTTPELMEIGGLPLITPYDKPTRLEALRYYRRTVEAFDLQVVDQEAVTALERESDGTFIVSCETARGATRVRQARAVVMAIGYYDHPVLLGVPGEDLPHVSHYYTEAHPYYRKRVVIVGAKNSAAETALELFRAGAHVTLVHRQAALGDSIKYWVRPDIENRIKEGSIAARFETTVKEIRTTEVLVEGPGGAESLAADAVLLMTGYRADMALMRNAGVEINPETEGPQYDAETYETNVPNLFVAGGALAGKHTGTVFIENGRFHGAKIIDALAPRLKNS
jgi:thioredoxin reductase (NADPH)